VTDIARHIHLNSPVNATLDADIDDIIKAHSLLEHSIKAYAYVLETKAGPETASTLWKRYQESLLTLRSGGRGVDANVPDNGVLVPLAPNKPDNKLIVKVDLGTACPLGSKKETLSPIPTQFYSHSRLP
jgi:hypothetical protein